jgi:hypothetical protein
MLLGLVLGGEPIDLGVGSGDRVDPAGHQPIDASKHRILFVNQGRDAVALRGEQGRQRRIAAEADHRGRLERLVHAGRHRPARNDVLQRLHPAERATGDAPGGQDVDRHLVEQVRNARAAIVGDERAMVAAQRSSSASAWAGTMCPPVPPAAST